MVDLKEVIIHAARKGEVGVWEELIALNVDVNNTRDEKGSTRLIIACYNGKAEAAAYLLSVGADGARHPIYTGFGVCEGALALVA